MPQFTQEITVVVDYPKSYLLPLQNIKLAILKNASNKIIFYIFVFLIMRKDFNMLAQYKWDRILLYILNFRNLFYLVGH